MAEVFKDDFETGDFSKQTTQGGYGGYIYTPASYYGMNGVYCYASPYWGWTEKSGLFVLSEGWMNVLWRETASATQKHVLFLKKGATNILEIRTVGELFNAYVGGSLVATGTYLIVGGTIKVGVHFKIDDTAGRIELRINDGTDDIDFTGDTKPGADTTFDAVRLGGDIVYSNAIFDDFILDDADWPSGGPPPPTGPTPGQLMRHGTWFGGGVKKPMKWSR